MKCPWMYLLVPICLLACSRGGDGEDPPDSSLVRFLDSGEMTLAFGGSEHEVGLEVMDIFLVEEEDQYPEVFHFHGPGIDLAGKFPMSLHVGYEEAIEKMEGKEIMIQPIVDLGPEGTIRAHVTLGGRDWRVTGGTLAFTKHLGDPIDAGEVIQGRADLELERGGRATGTFKVLAKTWG